MFKPMWLTARKVDKITNELVRSLYASSDVSSFSKGVLLGRLQGKGRWTSRRGGCFGLISVVSRVSPQVAPMYSSLLVILQDTLVSRFDPIDFNLLGSISLVAMSQ